MNSYFRITKSSVLFTLCLIALGLNGCKEDQEQLAPNSPPGTPFNPNPSNGELNVSTSVISWQCTDPDGDSLLFDIYFGISNTPPLAMGNNSSIQYPTDTLNQNTTYYWKIIAKDNHGNQTNGPLWNFTTDTAVTSNLPPVISGFIPANGAIDVPLNQQLSWNATDPENDPLKFDIYFGTSTPLSLAGTDISVSNYAPPALSHSATYYWQIVAKDNQGNQTSGPVLNFITAEPSNQPPSPATNPDPANGATNIAQNVALRWTKSIDPEGDSVIYDVYFGTSSNPPFSGSIASIITTYIPPSLPLNLLTTYYWKVVAKDVHGNEANATEWRFTTMGAVCPATVRDARDGKVYPVVSIGTQCWTAKNMAYAPSGYAMCYENIPNNCTWYGNLYSYSSAQTACPAGWHLPSDAEWKQLEIAAGMSPAEADQTGYRGAAAQYYLSPYGTSGFNAQYGGAYVGRSGVWAYDNIDLYGYYLTSTPGSGGKIWGRTFIRGSITGGSIFRGETYPSVDAYYSCRCVKD